MGVGFEVLSIVPLLFEFSVTTIEVTNIDSILPLRNGVYLVLNLPVVSLIKLNTNKLALKVVVSVYCI